MAASAKVLEILRLFTVDAPVWRVDRIAQVIQVSPSTAYRYVAQLVGEGLLDPVTSGGYVLGPTFIEFDRRIRLADPLLREAQPVMNLLREEFGPASVIALARCYRDSALYLHCEYGPSGRAGEYERGRPLPLFRGACSVAMLAALPDRALRALYQRHAEEIAAAGLGATQRDFTLALKPVRRNGWTSAAAEPEAGYRSVAAAITLSGSVMGCLALALPERLIRSNLAAMGERLRDAGDEIARQLMTREPAAAKLIGRRPPVPGALPVAA